MTTMQSDLLIHFNASIRRMGPVNEKGMEIGKILHFSFYEKYFK